MLGLLSQIKNNPNQDLLQQLVGEACTDEFAGEVRKGEKVRDGILNEYSASNLSIAHSLKEFFDITEICGTISESSKAKIQESLQVAQRYLYNQSGSIDTSFKVGNYVITFNECPMLMNIFLDGIGFSISYQKPDELLAFLSSNFDSTQSIFEILEQKDRLERKNQELKEESKKQQALKDSGISNTTFIKTDSKSDSIMQTLLKDSQKSKDT
ncbi:hypothetical protein [Helicobacter turcicus]|uniref:Uncharacterized protein n=1 Tax=Helicobacter turcicus TaxID=2867412 RepID=A0ABS7JNS9_9HELI|nr:hypothetical protein [Helicobacter turcicus]MBX7491030.1 hypothetical protein [Helicobacter turcicus]MBX7545843.1 hypothetical protein [Helicobacter turcicus]